MFSENDSFIDPKGKPTTGEFLGALFAIVAPFLIVALFVAALCGCSTGVRVVASSESATNIGNITLDGNQWPIISLASGPRSTTWVRDGYGLLRTVECTGCVTNRTTALGIYTGEEAKSVTLRLTFAPTNAPAACVAPTNAPAALSPTNAVSVATD